MRAGMMYWRLSFLTLVLEIVLDRQAAVLVVRSSGGSFATPCSGSRFDEIPSEGSFPPPCSGGRSDGIPSECSSPPRPVLAAVLTGTLYHVQRSHQNTRDGPSHAALVLQRG